MFRAVQILGRSLRGGSGAERAVHQPTNFRCDADRSVGIAPEISRLLHGSIRTSPTPGDRLATAQRRPIFKEKLSTEMHTRGCWGRFFVTSSQLRLSSTPLLIPNVFLASSTQCRYKFVCGSIVLKLRNIAEQIAMEKDALKALLKELTGPARVDVE